MRTNFRLGVKYGIVRRLILDLGGLDRRTQRKRIEDDMKHAPEELLDCLAVAKPKKLKDFTKIVDSWLSLEAKMTGFKAVKYLIGEGENIFSKIVIERALYYRNIDK